MERSIVTHYQSNSVSTELMWNFEIQIIFIMEKRCDAAGLNRLVVLSLLLAFPCFSSTAETPASAACQLCPGVVFALIFLFSHRSPPLYPLRIKTLLTKHATVFQII